MQGHVFQRRLEAGARRGRHLLQVRMQFGVGRVAVPALGAVGLGRTRPCVASSMASARTVGRYDLTLPKIVAKATSAASRPVPKRTKPIGMAVPDGSKMY